MSDHVWPNVPEPAVILLEGTRRLPEAAHADLQRLARLLGGRYPRAVFRSGNAAGADEVFAQAIASLDPARLELVVPNHRMGRTRRPPGCRCVSLEEIPDHEVLAAAELSKQASPAADRLAEYYARTRGGRSTQAAGRGMYLLRDTVKVMGSPTLGLAPAGWGIFFVEPAAPTAGGTGHTIRVCRLRRIPVATQREWAGWAG